MARSCDNKIGTRSLHITLEGADDRKAELAATPSIGGSITGGSISSAAADDEEEVHAEIEAMVDSLLSALRDTVLSSSIIGHRDKILLTC
jgi:hypothetical protein